MVDRPGVQWKTCAHPGCVGSRLPRGLRCLAHTGPARRAAALRAFARGEWLNSRGVPVDRRLLSRILAAAPKDDRGRPRLLVSFQAASFQEPADFRRAVFPDGATLAAAIFEASADFSETLFEGDAALFQARFQGRALFTGATVTGEAKFTQCWFGDLAHFYGARFHGAVYFGGSSADGDLYFGDTVFEGATELGTLRVGGELNLDDATFRRRADIRGLAGTLSCRGTHFGARTVLEVRSPNVVLDGSTFAAPSIVTGYSEDQTTVDLLAKRWTWLDGSGSARTRIRSLRRADLSGLTVADVDLGECRFAGAYNLDKLRIEGEGAFAVTRGWPRTARQILAEERNLIERRAGPDEAESGPSATEVGGLYRAIRKGREDNKDGPGASDFYYGEMQMRRRAAHEQAHQARRRAHWAQWAEGRAQHAVLWLYWLVSGYALRAWRALLTLAVVVTFGAALLALWGMPAAEPSFRAVGVSGTGAIVYQPTPSARGSVVSRFPAAVRISVRSATSLLRGPDRPLTPTGEWVETALRLIGPALLGLAVVSLRGRISR